MFDSSGKEPVRFSPDPRVQLFIKEVRTGDVNGAIKAAKDIPTELGGINTLDDRNFSALNIAVERADLAMVKALLANGANPNAGENASPLVSSMKAVSLLSKKFDPTMATDLLKAGADIKGTRGRETALYQASLIGSVEAIEFLIKNGVDINQRTELGESMMMVAGYSDHWKAVEVLLKNSGDPAVKNSRNLTLSDVALSSRLRPDSEEGQARERIKKIIPLAPLNEKIVKGQFVQRLTNFYIGKGLPSLNAVEIAQKAWEGIEKIPVSERQKAIEQVYSQLK